MWKVKLSDAEVTKRLARYNLKLIGNFVNMHTDILVMCEFEHTFERTLNHIIRGQANCPDCQNGTPYFTENICRKLIEYLLGGIFEKARNLQWLVNEEGNYLELDGYNKNLNVAFEYNGAQHYKYSALFHKTIDAFNKQKQHDILKQEQCIKNNVKLIIIPYTITPNNILDYIKKECDKQKITYEDKPQINISELMVHNVYINDKNALVDKELINTIWKRISDYTGAREHLTLKCIICDITEYKITYDNIMRGYLSTTCWECEINKIKQKCKEYGYIFEEYKNKRLKMKCEICDTPRNTCTTSIGDALRRITPCITCKKTVKRALNL